MDWIARHKFEFEQKKQRRNSDSKNTDPNGIRMSRKDQLKLYTMAHLRYLWLLLRCKDLNSAGARGIVRVWWETHQTIECRLIIKSSSCETNASSGRLSIELKCQASDRRTDNVKLLLRQAVGLSLYTEPHKVQEELELYQEIRAITAIG